MGCLRYFVAWFKHFVAWLRLFVTRLRMHVAWPSFETDTERRTLNFLVLFDVQALLPDSTQHVVTQALLFVRLKVLTLSNFVPHDFENLIKFDVWWVAL